MSNREVIKLTKLSKVLREEAETLQLYAAAGDKRGAFRFKDIFETCNTIDRLIAKKEMFGRFVKENRDFIKDANRDFQADRVEGNCVQDYVHALRELGKACDIIEGK